MCVCVSLHTCMCACMHACMCTSATCMCVCVCACVRACVRACVSVCSYNLYKLELYIILSVCSVLVLVYSSINYYQLFCEVLTTYYTNLCHTNIILIDCI